MTGGTASAGGQTRTTALNVRFPKKKFVLRGGRSGRGAGVMPCWCCGCFPGGLLQNGVVGGCGGPGDVCHVLRPLGGSVAPGRWQWVSSVVLAQPGWGRGCGAAWCHIRSPWLPTAAGFPAPIAAGAGGRRWGHGDSVSQVPMPVGRQSPGRRVLAVAPSWGGGRRDAALWCQPRRRGPLCSPFLAFPTQNPS